MYSPFIAFKSQVYISAAQGRLARGLLGWTQADLSRHAGVHIDLVRRLEGDEWVSAVVVRKIRQAFEARKVIFAPEANPYIAGE